MSDTKFQALHEAFVQLVEKRDKAERVIAADLPGDGLLTVVWESMIRKLIEAGINSTDERTAGNFLTVLLEELPGAMNYAEAQAEMNSNSDATATVAIFEEMLDVARTTLGDAPYTDIDSGWRHPPAPRRKGSAIKPR